MDAFILSALDLNGIIIHSPPWKGSRLYAGFPWLHFEVIYKEVASC